MTFPAPHPAVIAVDNLLAQCKFRAQRRSGPGGQHRNKTSSGVFLTHQPTQIVAEATERRSQHANRGVALVRLRHRLAVSVRTASPLQPEPAAAGDDPLEQQVRTQFHAQPLRINESNPSRPAAIALLLNDLLATGGQVNSVASHWGTSTTSIVRLLKSYRPAWELLNSIRGSHGRPPLK